MARPSVNLKQLAEQLGLSQTTVSRALNGFPEVSERTRARVQEAARRCDYRPSASAASLATGRTFAVGNVVTQSDGIVIDPHFSDFIAGAGETCARFGYDMLIRMAEREAEAGVYRDFVSRRRVDGVVVHGPTAADPRIAWLRSLALPFVVHGRADDGKADHSWLDVNNERAFHRATDFLLDLGHRRIALLNGPEHLNFAADRRRGHLRAMSCAGLEADPRLMSAEPMLESYGHRRTRELLARAEPPSAVLCASTLIALGVVRALHESGLQPGRQVSVLAYDDDLSFLHPSTRVEVPYLTAMRSSIRAAGRRVAEMLIERIERPEGSPRAELWEAELVVGTTTGPVCGMARS